MSHSDTIQKLPKDFECIASTDDVEFAAFKSLKIFYMEYNFTLKFFIQKMVDKFFIIFLLKF